MGELPDVITLGPEDEAKRLWLGALEAHESADADLVALCESIDLGLRAAEILVIQLLQTVKEQLPATIAGRLDIPVAEVDVLRDAVSIPRSIELTDLVDLLSEETLACVSPRLHRNREDRRSSCRRSRQTAQQAVGLTINGAQQADLLLLAAYRNRIFRLPPPVRIVPGEILGAFGTLRELVTSLVRP